MLAKQLLDTPLILPSGAADFDLDAEWDLMVQRGQITQDLIDGKVDWEYFLDFMAQAGYEPETLLDTAFQNLEFAIREGISIER